MAEIAQGGPADAAGIQVGDIITKIGDLEVTSADSLLLAVRSNSVGDTVNVEYVRDGQTLSANVTLGSDEQLQAQQEEEAKARKEQEQQQLEQWQQFNQFDQFGQFDQFLPY